MTKKVAILPCTGMGQVVGTIARQIGYRVCDDLRPDKTLLVCLPALVKGVQEDIDYISQNPVVVIEGCKNYCATYALELKGANPALTVFIPDFLKKTKIKVKREARRNLRKEELEVVEVCAKEVVRCVDELLRG